MAGPLAAIVPFLPLIGAGVQGMQGMASGRAGKKAGQELGKQTNAQRDLLGNVVSQGQNMLDMAMGMDPSFGGMRRDLMNQAQAGGQQLSGGLNDLAAQLTGLGDAGAGGYGQALAGVGQQLAGVGDGGAGAYGQQLAGLGTGNVGGYADQLANTGANFNFSPGSNMMDQAMSNFSNFAQNTRDQAGDQAAQAFTQGGSALDAALASRGISRGSGVAGGAIGNLAVQQGQTLAGVERDLANMGGQMGLEATQFDVGRMLQEQGMQSNFALGQAAQRGQNILGAGQLGLGALGQQGSNLANAGNLALGSAGQQASNLAGQASALGNAGQLALGSAGQQAANMGMAGNMMGQAYTTPLSMQQGMFSDNFMNPMLQQQSLFGGIGSGLMGQGLAGLEGLLDLGNQQTQQAGAGKGAGLGGMTSGIGDFVKNYTPPAG